MLIPALLGAALASVVRGQVITEYPIPTADSWPISIAAGPDGNLWFTEVDGRQIGRISPTGVTVEFPLPNSSLALVDITAGPDGNLWFPDGFSYGGGVWRLTTSGVFTWFPIPTIGSHPEAIAVGPDGNLWFTENDWSQIGRMTTVGAVTEFVIPTANSNPRGITDGPDGNVWFTESDGNKIGRITCAGVITEFPVPTANSYPWKIAAGPDGNLWFTEEGAGKIGRLSATGDFNEFNTGIFSHPVGIVAGPDGNLWFAESGDDQIGRITTAGVISSFSGNGGPRGIASGPDGNLWFTEEYHNQIGQITTGPTTPQPMAVDAKTVAGSNSNANGVFEPGETVQVVPSWKNTLNDSQAFTGAASNLTGPTGPTYTIDDGTADYSTIGAGASGNCNSSTGDCYLMTASGTRPAAHWDAAFTEDLSANSITTTWTLHVGESFPDVPVSYLFYKYVENLYHNGITGGCVGVNYCPTNSVTRAQMAVFLMKSRLGAAETPPPATGAVFADVPASNPFARWIEQLAGFQITGGCGGGNYCPNNPVTRAQMAVFLLKAEHGSTYSPPACAGMFGDVTCPSQFADWIEQLAAEGITGGCGGDNYCPNNPNTRGQMAAFLVKTFRLQLYGP